MIVALQHEIGASYFNDHGNIFSEKIGISEKLNGYMLDVYIMHYTNMHLTFLTNTICPLYVSICETM